MKEVFDSKVRYRTGLNEQIHFWIDTWAGDKPLALQFPDLFGAPMTIEPWSAAV